MLSQKTRLMYMKWYLVSHSFNFYQVDGAPKGASLISFPLLGSPTTLIVVL